MRRAQRRAPHRTTSAMYCSGSFHSSSVGLKQGAWGNSSRGGGVGSLPRFFLPIVVRVLSQWAQLDLNMICKAFAGRKVRHGTRGGPLAPSLKWSEGQCCLSCAA